MVTEVLIYMNNMMAMNVREISLHTIERHTAIQPMPFRIHFVSGLVKSHKRLNSALPMRPFRSVSSVEWSDSFSFGLSSLSLESFVEDEVL